MLNQKSQSSVFILIGIVSLIVAAFVIVSVKTDFFGDVGYSSEDQVHKIVKNCIKDYAEKGSFQTGLRGGNIYLPERVQGNPFNYVNMGFKVPIWDSNFYPTQEDIENQLSTYVETHAMGCIRNNLASIDDVYNYTFESDLQVNTKLRDDSVYVEGDLPVTYKKKNEDGLSSINDFNVELEGVRLKDMYMIAKSIAQKEANTHFLENLVIEQIRTASDYSDPEHTMPTEGMYFNCGGNIWTYPELKNILVSLNNNNFNYLQFDGTAPLNVPGEHKAYHNTSYYTNENERGADYNINLNNLPGNSEEFSVDTFVPTETHIEEEGPVTDFYTFKRFEVIPNDGGVVTPMNFELGSKFDLPKGIPMPIPCVQIYHHLYNLNYATVIKIRDRENGDVFQFPLRIKIERNTPKSSPISIMPETSPSLTNEKFCSEEPERVTGNYTYAGENTMRTYNYTIPPLRRFPLRVYVKDRMTGEYMEGVEISERCVGSECDIGNTAHPVYEGIKLTTHTPYLLDNFSSCVNAQIVAEKEGYNKATKRVDIDNSLNEGSTRNVYLKMTKVKKYNLSNANVMKDYRSGQLINPKYEGGYMYISFEANERDFKSVTLYPSDYERYNQVKLLADPEVSYNVTAYYMDEDYNLKGMKLLKNWTPPTITGSRFEITVPGYTDNVSSDEYTEFYKYVKQYSNESSPDVYG